MAFAKNLAGLPTAGHIASVVLTVPDGISEVIENQPGSQGSLRVYAYLAGKHGAINADAAAEGLALYAEHVSDALLHPGKHPNIDRLLHIVEAGVTYQANLQVLDSGPAA